jgi:hypothetical protein
MLAGLAAVIVVVLVLIFVSIPDIKDSGSIVAKNGITEPVAGSPDEGIVVHGHWTIEVRNPDSTLVERREFDNALNAPGGQALASILGRKASVGGWAIELISSAFAGRTVTGTGAMIVESGYPGTAYTTFSTLRVTAPEISDATSGTPLQLSGTATAETDGSITQVKTMINMNPATEAPSSRYAYSAPFTSTVLDTPVRLTARQTVTVTVTITFR